MFRTCIFCHSTLGENAVIERFPVGRRLAFDPEKGRLWVVCAHCRRWNLTPLEERWEAIEDCERRFRATRVRVSTDEIGLARLREGLELIRIGRPLRPEFAAWRYGAQLGSRRRAALVMGAATGVVATGALVGGAAMILAGASLPLVWGGVSVGQALLKRRAVARIPAGRRFFFTVRYVHLERAALLPRGDADWSLRLAYDGGQREFVGAPALRASSHLLAAVNAAGASRIEVVDAVSMIESVGTPERYFGHVARRATKLGNIAIPNLPAEVRLALEMSAHEESERRALEGELATLRTEWEEAEEIAAIADDLLVPPPVRSWIDRARAANGRRS
ncbi:MAG: hypothetical protein HOQ09_06580 [Gemmatimonadaceae bacterium]|nr:hypothetical protein [Gemmatimonadaceae bacterium]